MKISKLRGNEIYFDDNAKQWRFSSDNKPVTTQYDTEHPCGNCGKYYTEEGHDACLGTLIGTMNACCGHGDIKEKYIQFWDGEVVTGEDADIIIKILKKYKKSEDNQNYYEKYNKKESENRIMEEKVLEFILSGCIYTGKNEVTFDKLNDAFIELCEDKGWKFCGIIKPLEDK